jgi:mRNA interferase MazF
VRRGDIVLAAIKGDFGKARPFLVVQADIVSDEGYSTVVLCPLTSTITGRRLCRVVIEPTPEAGLRQRSEVMVEKVTAAPLHRLRDVIGHVDLATMREVERALTFVLGIGADTS